MSALLEWYRAPYQSHGRVADYPTPEDALAYVLDGLPVIPCDRDSKRPMPGFSSAKAISDPDYIRRAGWFFWPGCAPPGHNLAVALDRGYVGFDDDPDKGSEQTIKELARQGFELPPTRTHGTPHGGRHLLYRAPEGTRGGQLGPGLMLRGWGERGGSYLLVPPSVVDGKPYVVLDDRLPAELPAWVVEHLASHSPRALSGDEQDQESGGAVAWLEPEPTASIPTAIDRFVDQGPRDHDVSGQVLWFVSNCLEHGMTAGEALWLTVGWYRPAQVRYGADVEREVRRILAKLAPRHAHPGVPCDRAGCPHAPSWMRGAS